ncbi:hypothetical protein PQX77_002701 [Marasmius sp. AFHP31]|nr:hypothetical protein PQX77_008182 [Marasmius sp. AFHP31]KAK1233777.1 hypothetical protein PQX77_003048 [Marasmius sp. AFHP31]KAK1234101.1 hypothetical protein PQX77_002701 [Marasmius sp. AFHP31]
MIAVATTDSLSIIEPSILKKIPSSVNSSFPLEFEPSTTCWSTDNSTLYLASSSEISRFQPSTSNSLPTQIYSAGDGEPANEREVGSMVCKDPSTLIFSVGETIHILESCSTKPKLSSTKYASHKSSVTSLSLSTDNTFLLSTSSNGTHIHNLTLNSTTTLRGIPGPVTAGAFHTHVRTRFLIGSGSQLLVYDTARPSGPTKTFALEGMGEGDVQMIACSPFSKTLVAVGLGGAGAGIVGLIDLEKEKGLFRTVNTKVPITTLSFSPEGALIYAGTVTGRILILDLRSLDKPPVVVEIMGGTGRVVGISVQKKTSGSTTTPSTRKSSTVSPTTSTATSPVTRRTVSVSKPGTPATKRTVSTSARSATSTAAKPGSSTINHKTTNTVTRKVFSPIRSPLANSSSGNRKNGETDSPGKEEFSVKLETLGTLRRGPTSPGASTMSRKDKEREKEPAAPRTRTTSTISRASVASRTTTTTTTRSPRSTNSTSTLKPTESISTAATSRSSRSRTKSGEPSSSVPPVPPLPKGIIGRTIGDVARPSKEGKEKVAAGGGTRERTRTRTRTRTVTKTPSPDLPSLGDVDPADGHYDPILPLPTTPATKKGKGVEFRTLGLGTPGTKRTANMEDRTGKNVEFCEVDEADVESRTGSGSGSGRGSGRGTGSRRSGTDDEDGENDEVEEDEEAEELSMQISPARRPGTTRLPSFSETVNANIFNNFDVSPSRPSHSHGHGHGQVPHQSPQNLLRNIVHSVLSDFHLQTQREMTNLHLDLVRMGRGWRRDVKEVVREEVEDVFGGVMREMKEDMMREIRDGMGGTSTTSAPSWEVRELKEENRRLKEENERLKRVLVSSGSGTASA